MKSLTQTQPKITFTVDSEQASDIITSLGLFARIHPGDVATRCRRLSDYLWTKSLHDLGLGRAA
jgi:hypothetical protein